MYDFKTSEAIRTARRYSKLTQVEAAKAVGCSELTWRNKERTPGKISIEELRAFYGVCTGSGKVVIHDYLDKTFTS